MLFPMSKKVYLALVVTLGCIVTGFAIFTIWFMHALGAFESGYTQNELIENFNKKQNEIYTLKKYYNSIVPKNTSVEIEFEDNDELARFGIASVDSTGENYKSQFLDWDLKINSPQMKSLLSGIGWDIATLRTLKQKLDDANCISIESGTPQKLVSNEWEWECTFSMYLIHL